MQTFSLRPKPQPIEPRDNMGYPIIVIESPKPQLTRQEAEQLIQAKKIQAVQILTEIARLVRNHSTPDAPIPHGAVWLEYQTINNELEISKGYM